MNDIKKYFSPFIGFITAALIALTLSRLGLALWLNQRLIEDDAWFQVMLQGLRVDIVSLAWLLIVPAFIHCFIPSKEALKM